MPDNTPQEDLTAPAEDEVVEQTNDTQQEQVTQEATTVEDEKTETVEQQPTTEVAPEIDAAAIIAENQDLLSQIQTLLPDASPQPQASDDASAQQGDGAVEFGFDKTIVDNMIENPGAFASHIAETIYARIMQDASPMVTQAFQELSAQQQHLMEVRERFYQENPELVGHEAVVGAVATQLANQYPHITEDQLLLLTSNLVKKRFANTSVTEKPLGKETVTPLQSAGNAGNVQTNANLSPEQAELQDLLDFAQNQNLSL